MRLNNLAIVGFFGALLISCSRHDSPVTPSAPITVRENGALSRAEIDAYLRWSQEMSAFMQERMKRAPAMNDAWVAALQRGQTEPPEEYLRYQQEGAAKGEELRSREPLTPSQRDALQRTVAAIARIKPTPGATTLVWEVYHNEPALEALRRDLGSGLVNSIVEHERFIVDSMNQ
jgi:hypothetical protein